LRASVPPNIGQPSTAAEAGAADLAGPPAGAAGLACSAAGAAALAGSAALAGVPRGKSMFTTTGVSANRPSVMATPNHGDELLFCDPIDVVPSQFKNKGRRRLRPAVTPYLLLGVTLTLL